MNITKGKEMYFIATTAGVGACCGIVDEIVTAPEVPNVQYVRFKDVASITVNSEGEEETICRFGSMFARENECFDTLEELNAHSKEAFANALQEYSEEIQTLPDLVGFALTHQLYGEDTDWAAHEAYLLRAAQLLGVKVKELRHYENK